MSNLEAELQEIEVTLEELQKAIDERDVVLRLHHNPDFQKIVEKGYFINEASRMLLLKGDPDLPKDKAEYLEYDIYGPGAFKRYLHTIVKLGNTAEDQMESLKETMDEVADAMAAEGTDAEDEV